MMFLFLILLLFFVRHASEEIASSKCVELSSTKIDDTVKHLMLSQVAMQVSQ